MKILVSDNIMRDRCTNQLQLHCEYTRQHVRVDWWCPRRVSCVQCYEIEISQKCVKMCQNVRPGHPVWHSITFVRSENPVSEASHNSISSR